MLVDVKKVHSEDKKDDGASSGVFVAPLGEGHVA